MDKKRGSLSGNSLRKCLPMVHFSQIPIVEATVRVRKLNQLSALILDHEASQPAATPQACRPGGHSQRPGRSVVPAHSLWPHAGGPQCWGRPAKGTAVKNRLRTNRTTVTTGQRICNLLTICSRTVCHEVGFFRDKRTEQRGLIGWPCTGPHRTLPLSHRVYRAGPSGSLIAGQWSLRGLRYLRAM